MCPDNSNTRENAPCNRQPFQSESGCDRGSVDVHQFDDLPYCGPLTLTRPDVPPEVVDGPVPVPLPTFSCTCINIDHKFNLAYSRLGNGSDATPIAGDASDKRFDASVSFKAKGDCCEGNYESKLNLRIPCPVKCLEDPPKITVGVSYGDGPQSASASYLKMDCSGCTLDPLSPSIKVNIPCPLPSDLGNGGTMTVGIGYGSGARQQKVRFLGAATEDCEIRPLSPSISLNLPCPVSASGCSAELNTKGLYATYIDPVDHNTYAVPSAAMSTKVNKDGSVSLLATYKVDGWGNKIPLADPVTLGRYRPEDGGGGGSGSDPEFRFHSYADFNVPEGKMPQPKLSIECKGVTGLNINAKYARDTTYAHAEPVQVNEGCDLRVNATQMTISVPCPLKSPKGITSITGRVLWVGAEQEPREDFVDVAKVTEDEGCNVVFGGDLSLDMGLPCPIRGRGKYTIGDQVYAQVDPNGCKLSLASVPIDAINAMVQNFIIKNPDTIINVIGGGGGSGSGGGTVQTKCFTYVADVYYSNVSHNFYKVLKKVCIKAVSLNVEDEGENMVFHATEHACSC